MWFASDFCFLTFVKCNVMELGLNNSFIIRDLVFAFANLELILISIFWKNLQDEYCYGRVSSLGLTQARTSGIWTNFADILSYKIKAFDKEELLVDLHKICSMQASGRNYTNVPVMGLSARPLSVWARRYVRLFGTCFSAIL